jgi:hypothetical protein
MRGIETIAGRSFARATIRIVFSSICRNANGGDAQSMSTWPDRTWGNLEQYYFFAPEPGLIAAVSRS